MLFHEKHTLHPGLVVALLVAGHLKRALAHRDELDRYRPALRNVELEESRPVRRAEPLDLGVDFCDSLEIGIGNYPLVPFGALPAGTRGGTHAEFLGHGHSGSRRDRRRRAWLR